MYGCIIYYKQARSRGTAAAHFAVIEHLSFVCEGGYFNDKKSPNTLQQQQDGEGVGVRRV